MKLKAVFMTTAVCAFAVLTAALLIGRGSDTPKYYALEEYFFEGDFDEFRADMLRWYKSVEREEGVMLYNAQFYDKELLDSWSENGVYGNVPEEELWYAAASPSYLDEIGVKPLDGSVDAAWEGVRLYLLPNTLGESAAEKLKAFLAEDADKDAEYGGITNGFTERRETAFLEYAPEGESAPVYYVCTAENMTSFESDSLIATGEDGYIKFKDEDALERFQNDGLFGKYSLKFTGK
ncbi:MAG: hypothetical protein NC401_18270 [Ruminococcus sp.]|nr:hypothetical protein [Ruminococcus sp.]